MRLFSVKGAGKLNKIIVMTIAFFSCVFSLIENDGAESKKNISKQK